MSSLGTKLNTGLRQEMQLSESMVQSLEVLAMDRLELTAFIREQLENNPVLAEKEGTDSTEFESLSSDVPEADGWDGPDPDDDAPDGAAEYTAAEVTLTDYLESQISELDLSEEAEEICREITGLLDDDGYLVEGWSEYLSERHEAGVIDEALDSFHSLEPAGIGARDLADCVRIQLACDPKISKWLECIDMELLTDAAAGRVAAVASYIGSGRADARALIDAVKKADPFPARSFVSSPGERSYIVPDVIAEFNGGEVSVALNDTGLPSLELDEYYLGLADEGDDRDLTSYLREHIASAREVISFVEQRRRTLLAVAAAAVSHQTGFISGGDAFLRPLSEKEVAAELGISTSTVSRTVSGKYIQVPSGVIPLKKLFQAETGFSGGESSAAVMHSVRELIDEEDKAKPFSDQKIADILSGQGTEISRRTVAKYRAAMNIGSASERRIK